MEKDIDFDQIAKDRLEEKENQRKRLVKSTSERNSAYLYNNYKPDRSGKVWQFNGKGEERQENNERKKDSIINNGQNIITKGR